MKEKGLCLGTILLKVADLEIGNEIFLVGEPTNKISERGVCLTESQQIASNKTDESGYNVGLLDYIVGGEMVLQLISKKEYQFGDFSADSVLNKPIEALIYESCPRKFMLFKIIEFPYENIPKGISDYGDGLEHIFEIGEEIFIYAGLEVEIEVFDSDSKERQALLSDNNESYADIKHFKLTNETMVNAQGITLYRIECIKEIYDFNVKVGDKGGWVSDVDRLCGDAWIFDDAQVFGEAFVGDKARIYNNAMVYEKAHVRNHAQIFGNAQIFGKSSIGGCVKIYDNAKVYDNAYINDAVQIYDNAIIYEHASLLYMTQVFGNAQIFGQTDVRGKSIISDNAKIYNNIHINNKKIDKDASIGSEKELREFLGKHIDE